MSRNLDPFFAPRSIAVVGAAERATSSGGAVLQNLKIGGYPGRIFPVNPKGGTAFGLDVLTSLHALAGPAELCVIVIRPDLILEALREAAATGHRNVLVLPGGFAEAGAEGQKRDTEVRALAAEAGLTIAGPNCAGIIHLTPSMRFGATFLRDFPPGGGIALISQSGALAEEVIAAANQTPLALGTVVSVGNAMHLGVADYLEYLGTQDSCNCVLLYVESIDDPSGFRRIARKVAAKKPVVMLMGGRTAPGAAAARAHTGAVMNDDASIAAFAKESCVVRVTSLRRLMLAAKGFGFHPQGIGRRALVLSNSGGPGVLATDQAAVEGFDLAPLPAAMAKYMRDNLPPEASVANPIDLLADAREERFAMTLGAANELGGAAFDVILGIHVVPFMVDADPVVAKLADMAASVRLPFLHSMMGTLPGKAGWFASLERAGVAAFNDTESMVECAGLLAQYPPLKQAAVGPEPNTPAALKGR
ncbi:MAG TPA: CoA-binding protein [Candidatus Cybelea sp.]|nr:CoA-binding protein [Candidatus Cybelea sp.]